MAPELEPPCRCSIAATLASASARAASACACFSSAAVYRGRGTTSVKGTCGGDDAAFGDADGVSALWLRRAPRKEGRKENRKGKEGDNSPRTQKSSRARVAPG